jgi:hypothetical protein
MIGRQVAAPQLFLKQRLKGLRPRLRNSNLVVAIHA